MEIQNNLLQRYKETNLFVGSTFNLKVFDVTHTHNPILRLHWHDYLELLYIIEGKAAITIGTNTYDVEAGDILFVNCRQLHSGYSTDNSMVRYQVIVIDPELFRSRFDDPYFKKYILPYFDGRHIFTVKPARHSPYYKNLKAHVKNIVKEYKEQDTGYELKIISSIYSMIIDYARTYFQSKQFKAKAEDAASETNSIKSLISHIYLTCPNKMTVKEAAEYVNLSPYYFCKVFKKVTNKTFVEFLNEYRITRAKDFLLYTNDSISDISNELGFCNTNYFDKVFRKLNGCSPSAFRKQMSK